MAVTTQVGATAADMAAAGEAGDSAVAEVSEAWAVVEAAGEERVEGFKGRSTE